MSVVTINQENFTREVLESDRPVLVDFWATWCGPCRMMSPVVDEIAEKHPEVLVGKINVDEESELAMRYQVMSIPTLVLFKNGQPAATMVGARPAEEVEQLIQR